MFLNWSPGPPKSIILPSHMLSFVNYPNCLFPGGIIIYTLDTVSFPEDLGYF